MGILEEEMVEDGVGMGDTTHFEEGLVECVVDVEAVGVLPFRADI